MRRLSFLLPCLLAACSTAPDAAYPSLQPRPIERRGDEVVEVPLPAATPDPAIDAEVVQLESRLLAAARAFDAALPTAERSVRTAGKAPAGSEAWVVAQQALTPLDTARAQTADLLADIEALVLARGAAGQSIPASLEGVRARAQETADSQRARFQTLSGALR